MRKCCCSKLLSKIFGKKKGCCCHEDGQHNHLNSEPKNDSPVNHDNQTANDATISSLEENK